MISSETFDFILGWEVTSREWYEKMARHPQWPGGASGVTIGIGYDCGQQKDTTIIRDWVSLLGGDAAAELARCAGITGDAASEYAAHLQHITVPWDAATSVFRGSTLPRYAAQTALALPNCDELPDNAFGALISIGYNRGNGGWRLSDWRHHEMLAINHLMAAKSFAPIPTMIRSMQRLWPAHSDLWRRRDAEATFFEKALTQ